LPNGWRTLERLLKDYTKVGDVAEGLHEGGRGCQGLYEEGERLLKGYMKRGERLLKGSTYIRGRGCRRVIRL